jgi:general secretion pathway protein D
MSMTASPTTAATRAKAARVGLSLLLALTLALPPAWAQNAASPRPAAPARGPQNAPVIVNFVNADLEAVTRAMAALINRPILVDPRVRGSITVYSEQPQSLADAWQTYIAALRGLGFAVVESAGIYKVVPEADAKLQTGTVSVGDIGVKGDQVITQIFPLRYENPNNLVAVLRPLISANNTINASVGNNALVITDYADNLQRIARIITALDQPATTDVEVVPLQHAVAADLAPLVQRLSEGGGAAAPGVPGGGGGVTVLAESRSNALIVRAPNAARLAAVRATIARLDRPGNLGGAGGGGMYVVHLKNADAVKLATVVRGAFGALGGGTASASAGGAPAPQTPTAPGGQGGGGGGGLAASAQPSTGGFIQADPSTNSLVITAPEPLYRQVRALIDQLDSRRAQVYIESLIVEVSGGDAVDFGFQWQGLGAVGDTAQVIGAGTNFSTGTGGAIIGTDANVVLNQLAQAKGLSVGLLRRAGAGLSLAAIAKALQSQAKTNIISTPTLITLDNEEAKIVVGENVPFITGQFTQTGTAATNPFQTIERKDVGITLRIKPQIGEGGAVRMTIFQEQSSVKSDVAAGTNNAGPSTTKRSIESTVVVDDGTILVLGGLIEDRFVTNRSQVPLLGDIPFIGALFRSESRERRRSNLMVFLRPIVMRDADSANRFSTDRYDQIRGQQQGAQPEASVMLPINQAPVLPESGGDVRAPVMAPAPVAPPKAP